MAPPKGFGTDGLDGARGPRLFSGPSPWGAPPPTWPRHPGLKKPGKPRGRYAKQPDPAPTLEPEAGGGPSSSAQPQPQQGWPQEQKQPGADWVLDPEQQLQARKESGDARRAGTSPAPQEVPDSLLLRLGLDNVYPTSIMQDFMKASVIKALEDTGAVAGFKSLGSGFGYCLRVRFLANEIGALERARLLREGVFKLPEWQLEVPVSKQTGTRRCGEVLIKMHCPPEDLCHVDTIAVVIGASPYGTTLEVGESHHPKFPDSEKADDGILQAYVKAPANDSWLRFLPRRLTYGGNSFCNIRVVGEPAYVRASGGGPAHAPTQQPAPAAVQQPASKQRGKKQPAAASVPLQPQVAEQQPAPAPRQKQATAKPKHQPLQKTRDAAVQQPAPKPRQKQATTKPKHQPLQKTREAAVQQPSPPALPVTARTSPRSYAAVTKQPAGTTARQQNLRVTDMEIEGAAAANGDTHHGGG